MFIKMKNKQIIKKISSALNDEHSARLFYTKMITSSDDEHIKQIISEIRNDEIDHWNKLKKLQDDLRKQQ